MLNSTSKTYTLKRQILIISNKVSRHLSKPDRKFSADMTYGMLASGSCLLTNIIDQPHEDSKLESLGLVRDGSKSTDTRNVYEKGYHVTEACVLTANNHPVSIFSDKMFLKLDELNQDYVIHLTAKRKLYFRGKWVPATQLRNQRKRKIKVPPDLQREAA